MDPFADIGRLPMAGWRPDGLTPAILLFRPARDWTGAATALPAAQADWTRVCRSLPYGRFRETCTARSRGGGKARAATCAGKCETPPPACAPRFASKA